MNEPSRHCASCDAALAPRARFCRECGAAVEATDLASPVPPPPAPDSRRCPSCGASTPAGTLFCGSCGGRLDDPDPVAPAGGAPEPEGGRSRLAVAAVAACVAIGVLAAGGAYLVVGGGESEGGSAESSVASGQAGDGVAEDSEIAGDVEESDEGAEIVEDTPPEPEGTPESSELAPGRYVQSGSFRTVAGAEEEVARLRGEGIDVFAVPADWAEELLPGFQVLLVGPLAGAAEEGRVERALSRARVSGFGRDLSPSVELSGTPALAGGWTGEVEQSSLGGSAERKVYGAEVLISADGETGTIDYPELNCGGTLSLLDEEGFSVAYAETIEYGPCIDGGVWHMRPTAEGLQVVWLHESHDLLVEGTLPATG